VHFRSDELHSIYLEITVMVGSRMYYLHIYIIFLYLEYFSRVFCRCMFTCVHLPRSWDRKKTANTNDRHAGRQLGFNYAPLSDKDRHLEFDASLIALMFYTSALFSPSDFISQTAIAALSKAL